MSSSSSASTDRRVSHDSILSSAKSPNRSISQRVEKGRKRRALGKNSGGAAGPPAISDEDPTEGQQGQSQEGDGNAMSVRRRKKGWIWAAGSSHGTSDVQPEESGNASNGSTLTGLPSDHILEKIGGAHHQQSWPVQDEYETSCTAGASSICKAGTGRCRSSSKARYDASEGSSSDEASSPNKEIIVVPRRKRRVHILARFVVRSCRRFDMDSNEVDCRAVSNVEEEREQENVVHDHDSLGPSYAILPYLTYLDWEE